jgi:hypothetical protein
MENVIFLAIVIAIVWLLGVFVAFVKPLFKGDDLRSRNSHETAKNILGQDMKRPNAVSTSNSGSSVKQTDLKKEVSRSDIPRDGVWRKWRDKLSEIQSLNLVVHVGIYNADMERERNRKEKALKADFDKLTEELNSLRKSINNPFPLYPLVPLDDETVEIWNSSTRVKIEIIAKHIAALRNENLDKNLSGYLKYCIENAAALAAGYCCIAMELSDENPEFKKVLMGDGVIESIIKRFS